MSAPRRSRSRGILAGPLTRVGGPVVLVVLLLSMLGLRVLERGGADRLLAGEAAARQQLARLDTASHAVVDEGEPHPGLRGPFLDALPGMRALPELDDDQISYARDDVYMYGLARTAHRDAETGDVVNGYVIHAWPLRFGVTGDAEFQLTETGVLWEGQNRLGRSGTSYGFPPPFPDPEVGRAGAAWWPIRLPAQR